MTGDKKDQSKRTNLIKTVTSPLSFFILTMLIIETIFLSLLAAGEYFIAYLLSASNCIVTVTLGRAEGFDLLIVNPKNKTLKISVKTTFYKTKSLMMTKKVEEIKDPDLFYAFVRYSEIQKLPDYWIVPSKIVAERVAFSHQKWLETPKRDGSQHKDSAMRKFYLVNHKSYPPNWETILKQYKNNIDPILE